MKYPIRPTEITTNEWDQNLIKVSLDSDVSTQDKETILSIVRKIISLHNIDLDFNEVEDLDFDVELSIIFLNQHKENNTELISYKEIHGT
tara:strand:+ start:347 stop:616 length:270 start_codon:yes stop_codon:yes gene_type:complete